MSACLGTMEECRADTFTLCDQTVDSFKKVTDPFILVALELHPAIADFSPSKSEDGLLYAHPSSKGPIMTWLRNEVQFGWPMFPLRTEEQIIYAVGKNPRSSERRAIATGRFIEALVDEPGAPGPGGTRGNGGGAMDVGTLPSHLWAVILGVLGGGAAVAGAPPAGAGAMTPTSFYEFWLRSAEIPKGDRSTYEHEVLSRILESIVTLNVSGLQGVELLVRRLQVIREAHRISPTSPDYSSAEFFMGWRYCKGAHGVDPDLAHHVAAELKSEAMILKESRKAKEEAQARRRNPETRRGEAAEIRNEKKSGWRFDSRGYGLSTSSRRRKAK
ncbi:Ankyrin-1, partial [Durusdinium trenchii]